MSEQRLTLDDLERVLQDAERQVPRGVWAHVSSNCPYVVTGHHLDEQTLQAMVSYRPAGTLRLISWVRPVDDFLRRFEPLKEG